MANQGFHEDKKDLSKKTRDLHRALISLQEELEAVDWYRQRVDACKDEQLKAILLDNMSEEIEHSAMLVEWLRRNDRKFNEYLNTYVFTDAPVTEVEDETSEASEAKTENSQSPTIGTLKDKDT